MDNSGMGRRAAARRLSIMVALGCAAVGGGVTSPGCAEFDTTPVPVTHGSLAAVARVAVSVNEPVPAKNAAT